VPYAYFGTRAFQELVSRRLELQGLEFSTRVEYQNIPRFLDSVVLAFHSITYRSAATHPK
jgi:hypothetical protein